MKKTKFNILLFLIIFLFLQNIDAKVDLTYIKKIPILHQGRVKPLDSFARVSLLGIHGSESVRTTAKGKNGSQIKVKMSAMDWLLEILFDQDKAMDRKVFKIRNFEVVNALKLKSSKKHLYSFNEISPGFTPLFQSINDYSNINQKRRTPYQNHLLILYNNMNQFFSIQTSFNILMPYFNFKSKKLAEKLGFEIRKFYSILDIEKNKDLISKIRKRTSAKKRLSQDEQEFLSFYANYEYYNFRKRSFILKVIPPQWKQNKNEWFSPWNVIEAGAGSPETVKLFNLWQKVGLSYKLLINKTKYELKLPKDLFLNASKALFERVSKKIPKNIDTSIRPVALSFEVVYNRWGFFTIALFSFIFSFLLLAISWTIKPKLLKTISFWLMILGVTMVTIGISFRIYIMQRPPVTTLYESILFVVWITGIFSLIIEKIKKNGLGIMVGTLLGAALLLVARGNAADGNSMGMLAAVLNTRFWLTTHVITITIGYGACFVASVLAHIYLLNRIKLNKNDPKVKGIFDSMLGVTYFALLFTVTGTILGGIWADQSWGRFWGWDPKENGAMLICLWVVGMLHGRISGYLKGDSFAITMVFTNAIVAIAWFGVNLLGVGLHSYGFTSGILLSLFGFILLEVVFMVVMWFILKKKEMVGVVNNG